MLCHRVRKTSSWLVCPRCSCRSPLLCRVGICGAAGCCRSSKERLTAWWRRDNALGLSRNDPVSPSWLYRLVRATLPLISRSCHLRSPWRSYGLCGLIVLATISPTMAPKETMVLVTNADLMQTRQLDIVGVKRQSQRDQQCELWSTCPFRWDDLFKVINLFQVTNYYHFRRIHPEVVCQLDKLMRVLISSWESCWSEPIFAFASLNKTLLEADVNSVGCLADWSSGKSIGW